MFDCKQRDTNSVLAIFGRLTATSYHTDEQLLVRLSNLDTTFGLDSRFNSTGLTVGFEYWLGSTFLRRFLTIFDSIQLALQWGLNIEICAGLNTGLNRFLTQLE